MTLGMTLVYPVQWGVAISGAHGSYGAPARCSALSGFLPAIRENIFRCFAEEEKIQQNAKQNAAIREFSVNTRKKNVLWSLITTLIAATVCTSYNQVCTYTQLVHLGGQQQLQHATQSSY